MAQPTDARPVSTDSDVGEGQIYRRRYQRYSGAREGRTRSYIALITHSVRRALGVRRKWTAKVIPIILYAAAFIPVIGFIAVPAIFGTDLVSFDSIDIFSALALVMLVYAAAASPEMLCDDRRENVLPLYYSRGLSRWDYLLAKLLALGALMMSIAMLPPLILFLGNAFLLDQPFRYLASNADEFLRIAATAITLSVFFASIGLAISAMTERKGVASAIYIGFFLAGSAISIALFEAIDPAWSAVFALASPLDLPEGVLMAYFDQDVSDAVPLRAGVDPWWAVLYVVGYIAISTGILYRRYLREE